MAEETEVQDTQDIQDTAPDVSPSEEKALNDGWMHQEDWEAAGRDPDDWVDHREFNRRGELMGRIKEQSGMLAHSKKEIQELRDTVKDLVDMHSNIAEQQYNKLMKNLKAAKAEAIDNSDGETVAAIEEDIETLKAQHQEQSSKFKKKEEPQQQSGTPPELQQWLNDPANQWYHSDEVLRDSANGIATNLRRQNPDWTPSKVLHEMEARVRQLAPHKFSKRQAVGSGDQNSRPAAGASRKRTFNDLTDSEKAACVRFEKTAGLSREKYIEMLDQVGG